MTSRKTAYFVSPDLEDDVFIPTNNLNKALHGDKVMVYIYNKRSSRKPEAEVMEIVERKRTEFVGVIDTLHLLARQILKCIRTFSFRKIKLEKLKMET